MSCEVIHEYVRMSGERVDFTYQPGRVLEVRVDNELVKEIFVNQKAGESIRACASRLALKWQSDDAAYTADIRSTI